MTILADWEITTRCEAGMVTPFDPALVNPASLDVRLGRRIQVEQLFTRQLRTVDISHTSAQHPYWVWMHQFLLGETYETFHLPSDLAAQFMLKSSRAREGLEHLMAGYCDPGWHGSVLTLELQNVRWFWPVPIWYGMKIGQMVFHRMSSRPLRSYAQTGRYNNHATVHESLG